MIDNLYSIKDELSDYGTPVPIPDDDQALRWWHNMLTDNRLLAGSPKDFSLWHIGSFDTKTGIITGCEHRLIERGKE